MFNFTRTVCDCCGKVNPPTINKDNRITACCIVKGGFYSVGSNGQYGSNGKTTTEYFRFPFRFEWVGFWGWKRPEKKIIKKARCSQCNKKIDIEKLKDHVKHTCPKKSMIPIEWCNM